MKPILLALLVTLRGLLVDYLSSKKVKTAILTALAAAFIHDPGIRDWVVVTGLSLLGVQGLTDVGKSAAISKADAMIKTGLAAPLILTRTPTEPLGLPIAGGPPPPPASSTR
jgi:hypothetical protein